MLVNPIAPVSSLDFKLQYLRYTGDLTNASEQGRSRLLFQPVLAFARANSKVILVRPAIPILFNQPVYDPGSDGFNSTSGLGDIGIDVVYGRTSDSGHLVSLGIVSTLPTASKDELGNQRFTLGPEFLVGKKSRNHLLSILLGHQWDVAGSGDKSISLTTSQVFAIHLPGNGWSYGSTPVISYDHDAEQWTVPLNFVTARTLIAGGRTWKVGLGLNYYIEQADEFGQNWMVSLNITPVIGDVTSGESK